MAKHKKKTVQSKNKSKKSGKKGFAQRSVEPAGTGKPIEKKGGWLSMIGKVAKHLGSKTLDGLAMVQPELAPLREMVKAHYGFDERQVSPAGEMGQGGGAVVRVEDAPVAFARNPVSVGLRYLGGTSGGGQVVWVRDNLGPITTSASANTFASTYKFIYPMESAMFPNFYLEFQYWEKWRPLKAVIHFCHFAPTSKKTAVMLAGSCSETASPVTLGITTTSKMMGLEAAAQGSCYEDLSLVFEPESWKEGRWLGNYGSAVGDSYDNNAGFLMWATDANDDASADTIGYIYVELIFEAAGKRPAYTGAGLFAEASLAFRAVKNQQDYLTVLRYLLHELEKTHIDESERLFGKQAERQPAGFLAKAIEYTGQASEKQAVQPPKGSPVVDSRQLPARDERYRAELAYRQ
jgi:hypothetical protein